MDKIKNAKVKKHPNDIKIFIRIPYTQKITKENIMKILKKNGVKIK